MSSPDELDPEELDSRWNDITAQLGDIGGKREIPPEPVSGPRDYMVDTDDDEFIPPEPESRAFEPRSVLGWFLIAVGLIGVLTIALTRGSSGTAILLGLIAVAGLMVLVTGLPRTKDPDDDGARV